MIITISGKAGSGKSSTAKLLAKKLKLKHYSIGDLTRKIAKQRKISILELAKVEEKHSEIDKELDNYQKNLGRAKDNFVIDGRLSWHFIPNSIKIFLDVDDLTGTKRIFKDKRKTENAKTVGKLTILLKKRRVSEKLRYKKLYNINPYNKSNYDLVINTTGKTLKQVLKQIVTFINSSK